MKILILTQEESLYLPASFAQVCRRFAGEVACIVAAPAMSTHGGATKGVIKHVRLFGLWGSAIMALRVLRAKCLAVLSKPGPDGPFYSIESVARAFNVPYKRIERVKTDMEPILDECKADLLISISCPQIIGKRIRERFPLGCINVHGAPLPKYRGLMPAFWALRFNEAATAVTVHDLGDKLDNGAILIQREVKIEPDDTWDSLVRKSKKAGALALLDAIEEIKAGTVKRRPNLDEEATYFSFPTAGDRKAFVNAGRRFF